MSRKIFILLFVIAAFWSLATVKTFADDTHCSRQSVTVNLSATDPTPYTVVGWLCGNGDLANKTVQVTVPGATYSHAYWDFPLSPSYYSYVKDANNAGYATFNFDKLGTGESDHPTPELVTIPVLAYNTHQIIQDLRNGDIGGVAFKKVILVGHSMGSETAIEEAGAYGDVDGVIVTGHLHNSNPGGVALATTNTYPAAFDPAFTSLNLPLGYLTTKPGTRSQIFYNAAFADPAIIAKDEETKDVVSDGMLSTFFPLLFAHNSNNIHVPVLVVVGQDDLLYCPNGFCTRNFVTTNEASYYSSDACPQFAVIPNTGHDLNLHYSAPLSMAAEIAWANLWVGSNATAPAPKQCGM